MLFFSTTFLINYLRLYEKSALVLSMSMYDCIQVKTYQSVHQPRRMRFFVKNLKALRAFNIVLP